jgi:simple sugar transport system permease protein
VVILAVTWFILYRTILGRSIFAIGNSEESALRAGINILKTKLFVYTYMGLLSGIMGIVYFSEIDLINPVSLVGSELMVIAAVVIGGIRLTGGEGTILGAILGVGIIQIFKSTLVFLGLSTSWNDLFIGIILIASVSIISYQERKNNRKQLIFTK